jgi:hypothetical protein
VLDAPPTALLFTKQRTSQLIAETGPILSSERELRTEWEKGTPCEQIQQAWTSRESGEISRRIHLGFMAIVSSEQCQQRSQKHTNDNLQIVEAGIVGFLVIRKAGVVPTIHII